MLSVIGQYVITPIFNIQLFFGITFGQMVIALFGFPLLVKGFKALIAVSK